MEVFRLFYGIHFVLGIFVAMQLWMYIPAVLAVFDVPPGSQSALQSFLQHGSVSFLVLLWYFVWYASCHFAMRGVFPVVSNRTFAALTFILYSAVLVRSALFATLNASPFVLALLFGYLAMLMLAALTAFVLPSVQRDRYARIAEGERIRHARLDQMYRCNDPRIKPESKVR